MAGWLAATPGLPQKSSPSCCTGENIKVVPFAAVSKRNMAASGRTLEQAILVWFSVKHHGPTQSNGMCLLEFVVHWNL